MKTHFGMLTRLLVKRILTLIIIIIIIIIILLSTLDSTFSTYASGAEQIIKYTVIGLRFPAGRRQTSLPFYEHTRDYRVQIQLVVRVGLELEASE